MKPTRPPKGLASSGAALWRSIAKQVHDDGLELDSRERELLEAACRERDMLADIEAALVGQPRSVKGAQGQIVAHPLIGEARRSRQTIATLLKGVDLSDPFAAPIGGTGSRTTSFQARAAAQARRLGS